MPLLLGFYGVSFDLLAPSVHLAGSLGARQSTEGAPKVQEGGEKYTGNLWAIRGEAGRIRREVHGDRRLTLSFATDLGWRGIFILETIPCVGKNA